MKKHILFMLILVLGFSLFAINAKADNLNECAPGHVFSIFTGKPCVTATTTTSNTFTRDLSASLKSRGSDVIALQNFLKKESYFFGKVDGKFGKITGRAVGDYQEDNDLSRTEIVDVATRAVLNNENVVVDPPNSSTPVISGVSGPQTLNVNQQGTWTVSAYDRNGGNLSYGVFWGDESNAVGMSGITDSAHPSIQQSATFTHSYATSRIYTPTFIVYNVSGRIARSSLTVNVGNAIPSSSITVLSPNGGETWVKGIMQTIRWQDSTTTISGTCTGITNCTKGPKYYDITLVQYFPPCTGLSCGHGVEAFQIAKGISDFSYDWLVGNNIISANSEMSGTNIFNGPYTIKVCQTGTSVCDSSNSYFNIVNTNTQTPTISFFSPTSSAVGALVTITGTGFNSSSVILFGDNMSVVNPTYVSSNGTIINFVVPNLQKDNYSLRVSNVGNVSVVSGLASNVVNFMVTANYDTFATCLKSKNAVLYGTFWCPHCITQKALFGLSASLVPYVECSTADSQGQLQVCKDKGITAYPTWEFSDSSRLLGEIPLKQLAEKTSCVLPQ